VTLKQGLSRRDLFDQKLTKLGENIASDSRGETGVIEIVYHMNEGGIRRQGGEIGITSPEGNC
jgi:hypothetical protein